MIFQAEKETTNNIVIGKEFKLPLFSRYGKFIGLTSLLTGFFAVIFSIAPYFNDWSSFVFWLLYPFAAVSIITAAIAYFARQIWRPTLGIIFSIIAVIIAAFSGEIYVLGMAGSVNGLTSIAKTFVDALNWSL